MGAEVITRPAGDGFRRLPGSGKRHGPIHGEVHAPPPLEGGKYYFESIPQGDRALASTPFPGRQLPLDELFHFRTQF